MNAGQSGRVTIQDVATNAGVSSGTVSRVLNNRPGVNSYTKGRVLDSMKRLGYRPDQAARELSFARNTTIGLHVAYGVGRLQPFFSIFLSHLAAELRDSGLRFEEIGSLKNGLPDRILDGMVLFGAHDADPRIPHLREKQIPFVLLGHADGVSCVAADDIDGGRQAAEHLLQLGHHKIACILGGLHSQGEYDRLRGFQDRLSTSGIVLNEEYIFDGEFTGLGGYRAMRRALEAGCDATAVFAASDEMAVGAIAAAEDHGLRVPLSLSVVGFDDIEGIAGNRLTTVRQSIGDLAHHAVALLQAELSGKTAGKKVLPVQLVVRKSTARLRISPTETSDL